MARLLKSSAKGFRTTLDTLLAGKSESSPEVNRVVAEILSDVAKNGDAALLKYTQKFDGVELTAKTLRVPEKTIDAAWKATPQALRDALQFAAKRIESYHKKQLPEDLFYTDKAGVGLGWKWTPVDSVGLYVPGGKAVYPSSVLMNAIPAKVAGVTRMAMVVPAPKGELNLLVLAAAKVAGITEIYTIGGAQAVAALAYGTATIRPVKKIVGPGNAYVAAAKRQVFGLVGIDMIAGPSEILVIADKDNNPDWLAADLLSQAEHDEDARSILITDNEPFAKKVIAAVEKRLKTLSRANIAAASWNNNGCVIVVKDIEEATALANIIAAEHVELAVAKPKKLAQAITNAGAIFLGRYTPEAIGDYTAGPSHVLPTSGSAAFSSGLGVHDFLKRTSLIACDAASFAELAEATEVLAEAEGLGAHALSVKVRRQ